MPNKGNQGNRDQDDMTPTGTSGRKDPGGNEGAQEWSNESTPPPATETPRRRNNQDDEDSGLGNRNTFR